MKHPHTKTRADLEERWEKSVRTFCHARHSTDIPSGEIIVEGPNTIKHYTYSIETIDYIEVRGWWVGAVVGGRGKEKQRMKKDVNIKIVCTHNEK